MFSTHSKNGPSIAFMTATGDAVVDAGHAVYNHSVASSLVNSIVVAGVAIGTPYYFYKTRDAKNALELKYKIAIYLIILVFVILEILGWMAYFKNKKSDLKKAQKEIFYYNIPTYIPACIIIIIAFCWMIMMYQEKKN